ncbi:efflux transporter outer membrane subunit [Hydrogenophaga defluvii]|uniref:Efflux transporter outer membrane subunit n=1 Tax=Hydrogenophaga defluvii TaxID=249410 RepID=A0ABW2SDJ5_9BURK
MKKAVLAAALVVSLCACAGLAPLPVDRADAPVASAPPPAWAGAGGPNAWTGPPLGHTGEAWWRGFGDPQLDALVADSLLNNTSVATAAAALRQAQAQRAVAAAALWPQLAASAAAQGSRTAGSGSTQRVALGLDADWVPDIGGGQRSAVRGADATALALLAQWGDVRVQVSAEVALNYLLLRAAQSRLAIAGRSLASQLETLQITEWREQAGLVTAVESAQARAATLQTRAVLPALQTSVDQSSHALAVLSGRPPAALLQALSQGGPLPSDAPDRPLAVPAEVLRQRADVRAAELRVWAALAQVDQAEARRWPSLRLAGSLDLGAASLGALTAGASVLASLVASVAWPLLDGGATRAGVQVQHAVLAQAHQQHRATVLGALQEVEDALVALREDRLRHARLQQAADAATQAAAWARQRYSGGLIDFQTVLETQRTELGTQDSVATALADIGADRVRLFRALGGGWSAHEPDTRVVRTR